MHQIFCSPSESILINKEKKEEEEMNQINFNSNSTEIILYNTLVFMRSFTLSSISVTNFNSRKFRNNSKS